MYPVVSPGGVGGVQETRILVGPSWTAMRIVGAEAAEDDIITHSTHSSFCSMYLLQ